MPQYTLKLGKETYQIEHDETEQYQEFQAKIFAMTDIPPKNLKVLYKGKMIKDTNTLRALPNGVQLKIMGTKSGNQLKQTDAIIKEQSMMIEEPKKIERFGLVNIGNTCYMNASIQFLRSVPQINHMIKNIKPSQGQNSLIPALLADIFRRIESKEVQPIQFVQVFLTMHPEFQPFKSQHDADEFMQKILDDIKASNPEYAKILKETFEIQLVQTIKNTQIEEEPKFSITNNTKIGCSLGGMDKDKKVGTIMQGIRLGLQTTIQKKSPIDDQNHIYESKTKFNSLPPFLIVQMVRFFWKQVNDPDLPHSKPVATKICKPIDFGARIDLFDLCTDEVKEKLVKGREAYEEGKKRQEQQLKAEFQEYKKLQTDSSRPQKRVLEQFKEKKKANYKPLTEGLQTGMYQIHSVVTHLGNSVESGHYMAWNKQTEEDWTKYDDDVVFQQPETKVFQLRGGQPNLEIAYLFMFRKIYARPL